MFRELVLASAGTRGKEDSPNTSTLATVTAWRRFSGSAHARAQHSLRHPAWGKPASWAIPRTTRKGASAGGVSSSFTAPERNIGRRAAAKKRMESRTGRCSWARHMSRILPGAGGSEREKSPGSFPDRGFFRAPACERPVAGRQPRPCSPPRWGGPGRAGA